MCTWWMRSRPGACSTGWWATRFRRCCGTRCGAGFPRDACRPWRLRLIVEREREIRAFQKQEYWTIDVNLTAKKPPHAYGAPDQEERRERRKSRTRQRPRRSSTIWMAQPMSSSRSPLARSSAIPFLRSLRPPCSRKASRKLRFSVKRTMMLAQGCTKATSFGKEGSVGLITYMRTDSTRVSDDALAEVRGMIAERYGADYRARVAQHIYKTQEGRAGRSRSHSSDLGSANARDRSRSSWQKTS